MRPASLLVVFLLCKALMLAGREIPHSLWTFPAMIWQDCFVVLLFAIIDRAVRRRSWITWLLYSAIALYASINVPIARMMSTPLTWPMIRAARGPLSGSIGHQINIVSLVLIAVPLAAAAILPFLLSRLTSPNNALAPRPPTRSHASSIVLPIVIAVVAIGPYAATRVDTLGRHSNALALLFTSALPRIQSQSTVADWRASPFPSQPHEDLSQFRASAAGHNVIVVILESAGARYLRPWGAAEDPMPNLTRIAAQSIVFENAYTAYPESIKGLFATLCSRYPALDSSPEDYANQTAPSLAQGLKNAGYHTGLFHSGRFMYLGMNLLVRNRGFDTLEDAGDIGGDRKSSFGIDEPSAIRRILTWIDAVPKDERFFIAYLPIAGHHPYETPTAGPFGEAQEIDRYRNALHYGDESIGTLMSGLQSRGLDQKTVLVFFGDHGEAFGQHDGNFGHTNFIYEENVHVPFMIAIPGVLQNCTRVKHPASLIDNAPTIVDLLGLEKPKSWHGRSLLDPSESMSLFFTDYSMGLLGLRDGPWKFIHELESGHSKLFILADDPNERQNLSEQFPDRTRAYRDHLIKWAAAQKHLLQSCK